MSNVAYRATVYVSRTDDPSETTVLTPIAGAPHSDPFKIATRTGITGFQPYMDFPSGRRGKIDMLSKKTDIGELTFDIIDIRTAAGGINANRWVTAFIGTKEGIPRFARLKCFIEESLDGGITWTPFFTGRVRSLALGSDSLIVYKMSLRDLSDDLSTATFTGLPHDLVRQTATRPVTTPFTSTTLSDSSQNWTTNQWVGAMVTIAGGTGQGQMRQVTSNTNNQLTVSPAWTPTLDATTQYYLGYAQLVSVMPVGLVRPYGIAPVTKELKGKVMTIDSANNWALVHLDSDQRNVPENQYTMSLHSAVSPGGFPLFAPPASAPDPTKTSPPNFSGIAIARVTRTDTGAEGDFYVGYSYTTKTTSSFFGAPFTTSVWALAIKPLVYPLGVATGTPLVNGAQSASPSSKTQAFNSKGWTASITGIVKAGDILSFANHLQRYMVQADANSDGTGLATITVSPGLQLALIDNDAITVQRSPGRMDLPPAPTPVKLHIVCDMALAEGAKDPFRPGNLLAINDVHPAQVLKDVVLGCFGRTYRPWFDQSGALIPVALPPGKNLGDRIVGGLAVQLTDNAGDGRHGFNALIADTTFPLFRCIVDAQMPIRDFVEKYICQAYGIGYYIDGAGTFVPVDMRQPSSVPGGIATLTDADLVAGKMPGWSYDPTAAVTWGAYTVYGEGMLSISAVLMAGFMFPVITAQMFEVKGGQIIDGDLGNLALSDKQYQVDFKGYRAMPGETAGWFNNGSFNLGTRYQFVSQMAIRTAHAAVARPYGNGPMIVTLTARRNASTVAIYPGSFFLLNISTNPDPASNTRGPIRLVLCTERAEDGPSVKLAGADWGVTLASNPPTLGTPAQLTGDPGHSATCAVTLNAETEPVEVWINITPTTVGVRPPDNDANWMFVRYNWVNWIAVARFLPGGTRIWWRGRTMPKRHAHMFGMNFLISALKLPSGWRYPSSTGGTDFVDLSTLSAATGLTASLNTANSFRVSWTNPDPTRQVEVWLATPTTDPRRRLAVLSPGSTLYDFKGLGASKTYRVAIRTIDGAGGYAEATLDVTTTAGAPIIPPPYNNRSGRLFV
jgi:hypothetical protein